MHLNKSKRNSHLAIPWWYQDLFGVDDCRLITLYIPSLFEIQIQNQSTDFFRDPYYLLHGEDEDKDEFIYWRLVGSCNGLLCLISVLPRPDYNSLCFWNPAMRTKSDEFAIFSADDSYGDEYMFSFGYDNSTQTYKVVASNVLKSGCNVKSEVKVFSLGDNSWRDLPCFPFIPLYLSSDKVNDNGLHLNGTINWLAFRDYNTSVDQYLILSLDLSTETYTQLLLPLGLDNVPKYDQPILVVLMDRLCFCYDFEETHFVIWQMKDFGVQDSWIQLFKLDYENRSRWVYSLPLYLSENGDTLLLAREEDTVSCIYSCIDKKVEKAAVLNNVGWLYAMDYVESLVPTL
jgi:F-box interacting protein